MSARIAVGVSGSGSNLRALVAAADRGELGGDDRARVRGPRRARRSTGPRTRASRRSSCPGGDDAVLADTLAARRARRRRPRGLPAARRPARCWPRSRAGSSTSTRRCCRRSPGSHAVRDALAAGVAVTGVTVHLVDATLDGGPIVAQEAVPVLQDDTEASLLERIHAVEHRLLPDGGREPARRARSRVAPGARRARLDPAVVDAARARAAPRAAVGLRQDRARRPRRRGLVARGFELVSTGGTARALREAGLPVTDVAAVTGFPEMLDGRVKTLHPRVHAGLLADRRRADHREALAAAGIAPFDLVVVNLYPFAEAARKPGLSFDELVEEIDIGGPSMVRAAAKNHASVAIVTSPARYDAVLAALDEHGEIPLGLRSRARRRGLPAHRGVRRPDRGRAAGPDGGRRHRPAARPGLPGRGRPVPAGAHDLARQGRDPALRREPAPARGALPAHGPRPGARRRAVRGRRAAAPGQGAQLQQRARRVRRGGARPAAARARPSSSSSTRTRAAPPSARRCSRRGTRRSRATRCRRSAASSRSPGPWTARSRSA